MYIEYVYIMSVMNECDAIRITHIIKIKLASNSLENTFHVFIEKFYGFVEANKMGLYIWNSNRVFANSKMNL